ncbi:single-stranded-DNA-specific exonuclease RecJ [Pseudomonas lundensis]|jgi:single-stranded-DNA-specific exonuclease|uniref:Single-stranded-DNA-specific exonuclease RecJ n=1 Tax=Pseudomonas lundensis TaxID=86185 RepID=A0ABX4GP60_9PSED|nr:MULTISPECIES: single-stranded-DNA-specific exonuclease RecJ [Pseudomonas]MBM1182502.1 single-stranded-DNA-specific exonuclease RecJ [Pseudomonas lundensis]MCT8952036.1 single-stranded-DNA-specific exonuclease RecJ [Pseudomonas lundensis]NMY74278.1 single-stranded-DNA-specific exonuclease RecJ [Pseudomonas sp. WS 5071]NMZ54797.1 single-stranded-DNA-specific exonuclease RecJ [Pseudomonas lundensis]NNA12093.1 single-stranded-DNA-specific exonuclease RecJ [Pseudomonas lundensis]
MRIEPRPLPETLPFLGEMPTLLTRLYAARGVQSQAELDKRLARLIPYQQLKGIEAAVDLLVQALDQRQRILIVGDFDADGATASTVGMLGLRLLGAAHVDYLVPNRFEYGYGLTPEIVEVALTREPQLLITVDNGISSVEGVAAAKKAGLKVLVTDHHLPGTELPAADAIVNPNQPGCAFPSKALAGVGVIFYVLIALRARLNSLGRYEHSQAPNIAELLDLVALGSVADVVPLDANNRILVHQGLERIRAGRARPGLKAILEVAKRDHTRITSTDLGFILGPRLNAAGRLDDMSLGIECLLTDDANAARAMAAQLDEMNQDRKSIEQGMQREALAQLKELPVDSMPFGLCLFDPDWHQGVIGILASRLKERYFRPTFAFADAGDGLLKGSGRSVPGFHIRDALSVVAAQHPDLIAKYGGHAMAAGLTLPVANFEQFSQAFDAEVRRQLREEDLTGRLLSDGSLTVEEFHLELARALRNAGPWGQHFPEPLFHGVFELVEQRIVGERHLKVVLKTECGSVKLDGIAFGIDRDVWPNPTIRWVELAYKLDLNEFRGNETVQLMIAHIEPR